MNAIILIGYRGVGKSTIASKITELLSLKGHAIKVSFDEELAANIGNLQTFIKEKNAILDMKLQKSLGKTSL